MRLWYWFLFRVLTRCFVCQRLMVLHTHRQMNRCINTPLAIELPEYDWQLTEVVPVSHAQA
jgi:hypothetical protein